jgi:hypothetical protein
VKKTYIRKERKEETELRASIDGITPSAIFFKYLTEKRGATLRSLSLVLNWTYQECWRVANDRKQLTWETILTLAKYYKLSSAEMHEARIKSPTTFLKAAKNDTFAKNGEEV